MLSPKTTLDFDSIEDHIVKIGQQRAAKLFWKFTSGQFLSGRLTKLLKGKKLLTPKSYIHLYDTKSESFNTKLTAKYLILNSIFSKTAVDFDIIQNRSC